MSLPGPIAALPRGLPLALASAFGAARGRLAYHASQADRNRAETALGRTFRGDESRQRCRAAFIACGRAAAELAVVRGWNARRLCRHLSLRGWSRLTAAEEPGRGVLILPLPSAYWPLVPMAIGLYRGLVDLPPLPGGGRLESWAADLASEPILEPQRDPMSALARLGPGRRVLSWPFERGRGVLAASAEAACATGAPWVPVGAEPASDGSYRLVVEPPLESRSPSEVRQSAWRAVRQAARRRPELWPWWSYDPESL